MILEDLASRHRPRSLRLVMDLRCGMEGMSEFTYQHRFYCLKRRDRPELFA